MMRPRDGTRALLDRNRRAGRLPMLPVSIVVGWPVLGWVNVLVAGHVGSVYTCNGTQLANEGMGDLTSPRDLGVHAGHPLRSRKQ
jgi:hypothetical protein